MNIFIRSINNGKIKNTKELKKLFWKLSLKYHPDTTIMANSEKFFIQLKIDYDEACTLIKNEENKNINKDTSFYNRKECIQVFTDLIHSNFPINESKKSANKTYLLRLYLFSSYLSLSCSENNGLLDKMEKELYQISNRKVHNGVFGIVKFLLYNISSWHYHPTTFAYKAIKTNFNKIKNELIKQDLINTHQFLKWLIDDMDHGSALT